MTLKVTQDYQNCHKLSSIC